LHYVVPGLLEKEGIVKANYQEATNLFYCANLVHRGGIIVDYRQFLGELTDSVVDESIDFIVPVLILITWVFVE